LAASRAAFFSAKQPTIALVAVTPVAAPTFGLACSSKKILMREKVLMSGRLSGEVKRPFKSLLRVFELWQ
jgi:hypothetical protein